MRRKARDRCHLGIRATSSIGDAAGDLSCSGRKPRKQSHPRQKSGSIVTAITARSALEVTISMMGGDSLKSKSLVPELWQADGSDAQYRCQPRLR